MRPLKMTNADINGQLVNEAIRGFVLKTTPHCLAGLNTPEMLIGRPLAGIANNTDD
jgi:hypothetical protein